jgi:hypothetical protein
MLLSRWHFFAWLFLLMVIPFPARKVIWLAGSRQIMGKVYFTGHHFDPLGGIASHLVVIFYLGRDSIVFNNNVNLGLPDDSRVPVRYAAGNPADARVDTFLCIWGDTFVWMLLPTLIWIVLFLTPNRFDPLIPWRSKILLGKFRPFIRVLPEMTISP